MSPVQMVGVNESVHDRGGVSTGRRVGREQLAFLDQYTDVGVGLGVVRVNAGVGDNSPPQVGSTGRVTGPTELTAFAESARGCPAGAKCQIGTGPFEGSILTIGEGFDRGYIGHTLPFDDEVVGELVREQ